MYAVRFYKNLFTDERIHHLDASGVTADPALGEDSVCLHLVCAGSYNLLCRCVVFGFRETIYSLLWKGSNLTFRLHLVCPSLPFAVLLYFFHLSEFFPACYLFIQVLQSDSWFPHTGSLYPFAVYFILNLITQIISIGVSIITSVFPDYVFSPAQTVSSYFFRCS